MKKCGKCEKKKDLEEFYRNRMGKYGRHSKCKACHDDRVRTDALRQHALTRCLKLGVPAWQDREELVRFYLACPAGKEVDHIIPTGGKTVTGLHVLANLQYLTPTENKAKGNTWQLHS